MFDTSLRDSQSTAVTGIAPEDFDLEQCAEYAALQDEKVRKFWASESGVLVYRRFRVAEVYGWECQDRELSLRLQLGALKESMKYAADMAKRVWQPGLKLIVNTYCKTPEEQQDAYDRLQDICK